MEATKSFDKFLKKAGLTEEEREEYKNALSQRTKEKIEEMLKPKEETGAIEFLQHARDLCLSCGCKKCPFYINVHNDKCIFDTNIINLTDNEIADLVREVERWNRERSKDGE